MEVMTKTLLNWWVALSHFQKENSIGYSSWYDTTGKVELTSDPGLSTGDVVMYNKDAKIIVSEWLTYVKYDDLILVEKVDG